MSSLLYLNNSNNKELNYARNGTVLNTDNNTDINNNVNSNLSNNFTSRLLLNEILKSALYNNNDYVEEDLNGLIKTNETYVTNNWHSNEQLEPASLLFILFSVILSSLVVCTFIGNLFVIIAILVDKNLQTAANLLVLSLAFADFMVACLVMPLGAYNDLYQGWFLGTRVCEFWTSADVLCCTGKPK